MSEFDLDDALSGLDIEDSEESAGGTGDADLGLDALGDLGGDDTSAGEDLDLGDGSDLDAELAGLGGGESDSDSGDSLDIDAELGKLKEEASAVSASVSSSSASLASYGDDSVNIDFLLDIKLHVTFEVGRSKMLVSDLLTLGQGSVIELHRLVGDELDLLVNGKLVARGEVVVVNEKFGCRINQIVPPEDRVKYLGEF